MKIVLVLIVMASSLISGLWLFGFIGSEAAGDLFTRSTALIAIAGAALSLSYLILRPQSIQKSESSDQNDKPVNPGPQF